MNRKKILLLFEQILNFPILIWVSLGFLFSYLYFFIHPIFFAHQVMQFPKYIDIIEPIGDDLRVTLGFVQSWFIDKQYIGSYPPFFRLFFAPLTFIAFGWAYRVVTLATLVCFAGITFLFPLLTDKKKQISPLFMLILITGFLSYGLQFEIERGQFNVIAIFLCFLSIWIFHYHQKYWYLAYIFFTMSVQLKIYPIIFIVMFIRDWKDWKNNIKRFLLLVILNFASLFVLGLKVFDNFMKGIIEFSGNPQSWVGNHSIVSFVMWFTNTIGKNGHDIPWIKENTGLLQVVLLAIIVICLLLVLLRTYQQNERGINSPLLLACTIGALLLPSVSHDYTLSLLGAPVAILLANNNFWEGAKKPWQRIIFIMLLVVFSAAYSSTLFSYTNKPFVFQNSFVALIVMLIIVTILFLVSKTNHEESSLKPNKAG